MSPKKRRLSKTTNKKPKGNQWEDHLTRKAKAENYPARSVYKLKEIQSKFKVMKPGDTILDLGCAPGSWLLYAAQVTGIKGKVFGIDLKKMDLALPANTLVIQDDILALENHQFLNPDKKFDVILSDMAPATTGRKEVDAFKSYELCCKALTVVKDHLAAGGHFVCKIFQGNDFHHFQKDVKFTFKNCKIFKPDSCRKSSKEIYIIAKGKK